MDSQNLTDLLKISFEREATDLHLTVNSPPALRIHGQLVFLDQKKLSAKDTKEMIMHILSAEQKEMFEKKRSIDFGYSVDGVARFRVNAFYQKSCVAAAFRRFENSVRTLQQLGLPQSLYKLSDLRDGLVLVTGPTGSGKSTTLSSMIDRINETRAGHIITIEDPIEYTHEHKKGIVNQREIHTDAFSFSESLRYALREDHDVILVGEMRDLDTIRTAIMAAETGHLVFSTLHTRDAVSSIGRMIGVFAAEEQQQIRHQLSLVLKAVVSQRLLRRKDNSGLVAAVEIMMVTPGTSNLIRLAKEEQIYSAIETGGTLGMQTMEQALCDLYGAGKIDRETVLKTAKSKRLVERWLE